MRSSTENVTTKTTSFYICPPSKYNFFGATSVTGLPEGNLKQGIGKLQTFIKCKFLCIFLNWFILGLWHLRSHRYYLLAGTSISFPGFCFPWSSCSEKLKVEKTSSNKQSSAMFTTFQALVQAHRRPKSRFSSPHTKNSA